MNIAFISAVFPYPLHSGGQVRVYNLLKRLSKSHDITLFAFIRDESEKKYSKELSFCKKVIPIYRGRAWKPIYILRSLFSKWPFLYATYEHRKLRDLLIQSKMQFDLIHIEPGYVYSSLPDLHIPLIVAEHNIEHEVYQGYVRSFPVAVLRPLLQRDVNKMIRIQSEIWNKASSVVTVSDDDATYISLNSNQKSVHVVPNGTDLDYFAFSPKKTIEKKSLRFTYVGNFLWMQNTNAIEHILKSIWPIIAKKYPDATFTIVGKHFPYSLKSLLTTSVTVIDSVPDIRSIYSKADILLAPIRIGGGTRYKILEAMATGLPVITSTLGASGLPVTHSKELYIADTVEEILAGIGYLTSDLNRMKVVTQARTCIEKAYSWELIAAQLDTCWRKYEKR